MLTPKYKQSHVIKYNTNSTAEMYFFLYGASQPQATPNQHLHHQNVQQLHYDRDGKPVDDTQVTGMINNRKAEMLLRQYDSVFNIRKTIWFCTQHVQWNLQKINDFKMFAPVCRNALDSWHKSLEWRVATSRTLGCTVIGHEVGKPIYANWRGFKGHREHIIWVTEVAK